MRDAVQAESQGDDITVVIGRFGGTPENFTVPKDTTVEGALKLAGMEYNGDNVFVNGTKAPANSILDSGDTINVVSSKQGG